MIHYRNGQEDDNYRYCNQYDRPIDVEAVVGEAAEIEPHDESEKESQKTRDLHMSAQTIEDKMFITLTSASCLQSRL